MARLYTDENFSQRVVEFLRAFGHDVLIAREAENAGIGICTGAGASLCC